MKRTRVFRFGCAAAVIVALALSFVLSLLVGDAPGLGVRSAWAEDPPLGSASRFGMDARLATHHSSGFGELTALKSLEDAHVKWVRELFDWRLIQPTRKPDPHVSNDPLYHFWSIPSHTPDGWIFNYDVVTRAEADAGVNILGLLVGSPLWPEMHDLPVDAWVGEWGSFVREVVTRYGSRGNNTVHYWEVWNLWVE